jgi:hypothetical protein
VFGVDSWVTTEQNLCWVGGREREDGCLAGKGGLRNKISSQYSFEILLEKLCSLVVGVVGRLPCAGDIVCWDSVWGIVWDIVGIVDCVGIADC